MTLLELACTHEAEVVAVSTAPAEERRLHAIGVYVGSILSKIDQSPKAPGNAICISTGERSVFAISERLAAAIEIRPIELRCHHEY